MSPEFVKTLLEGIFVIAVVVVTVKMVDLGYAAWVYRRKATRTDWENQFQVQRFVNELIHDNKIEKGLKKGFLQAVAEDCRTHGHDSLAEKAEKAAKDI